MRIAFVNSMRQLGGGERWLLEVAAGLSGRGHDAAVVARSGSALASASREAGYPVLELPMTGDADVVSIVRLSVWMARFAPDLVSVNVQRAVRVGGAAARLARIGPVVERRGLNFPPRRSVRNRFVYGRWVTHVIANCRALADEMADTGVVERSRITIIPNGIDPGRVPRGGGEAVRAEFGIAPGAPLIAMVARLVGDKRHVDAFEAMSRVLVELPEARMLVVGDGELRGELEAEAARLTPERTVVFAGRREDVPAILDAADVLAVASIREGMPHSILEAMAAGTPVVATSVAGIPEMIEDGRHGLLVPARAPSELAGAILRALSDPDLASRLAAEARQRVAGEFSLTTMIDRVEECFAAEIDAAGGTRTAPRRGAREAA
jgi:glycosyltransferase involved in cell wall biosynthesis